MRKFGDLAIFVPTTTTKTGIQTDYFTPAVHARRVTKACNEQVCLCSATYMYVRTYVHMYQYSGICLIRGHLPDEDTSLTRTHAK